MKVNTFKDQLTSNLDFAVSYIVANNPEAVVNNLRGLDFMVGDDPATIFGALNELLAAGEWDIFQQALNVPMVTQGVDAAQMAVVLEVAQGMHQMSKNAGGAKTWDVEHVGYAAETPDEYVPSHGSSASGGASSGAAPGTGFANVFGAIINGFATLANVGAGAQQPVNQVPTNAAANQAAADQAAARKRNMRKWGIGIGIVAALALLAFIIYSYNKRK